MLPDMDVMNCQSLAVPATIMKHVVEVESSFNPYAIGVVGARLVRQPKNLQEAVATARTLADKGYNFSLGLAQVNRYNLARYGLFSYRQAFDPCANLRAGTRILSECYLRSGGDWGKSFSCYYSGDFTTGFRAGYVQKVLASIRSAAVVTEPADIPRVLQRSAASTRNAVVASVVEQRLASLAETRPGSHATQTRGMAVFGADALEESSGAPDTPGRRDSAFVF